MTYVPFTSKADFVDSRVYYNLAGCGEEVGTYTTTITKQDGIFMVSAPAVTTKGSERTVVLGTWLFEFSSDGY